MAVLLSAFRHFARLSLLLGEPTVRHASHTAALSIAPRFSEFSLTFLKIPFAYLQKFPKKLFSQKVSKQSSPVIRLT